MFSNKIRKSFSGSPAYEESSSSALLSLFVYSGLMFTVPLLVYFGAKEVLTEHFGVEPPASFLVCFRNNYFLRSVRVANLF